jgi:RNA 3'-terminal phosphate cyclase (ATP)
MITIDGARGEGGGQILRSALTLSLLTRKPFRLTDIRARRSKPGLRPQHLQAVQAAARLGKAKVTGATLASSSLQFEPGEVRSGHYLFDIGTAGATSLVLQTLYLPLAFTDAPSVVTIKGGTHVPMSPCFHYLDLHWRRFLQAAGLDLSLTMERAGFYPPGGGIIQAMIHPTLGIKPLRLTERGQLRRLWGLSAVANLAVQIAERQRDQALRRLAGHAAHCSIVIEHLRALSKGTVLLLLAEFEHTQACFFALGAPGKPAERVADEAVEAFFEFLGREGVVEPFLADQLLLPLVLAEGESVLCTTQVTRHLLTNADVIRDFLPVELAIEGLLGEPGTVRIHPVPRS